METYPKKIPLFNQDRKFIPTHKTRVLKCEMGIMPHPQSKYRRGLQMEGLFHIVFSVRAVEKIAVDLEDSIIPYISIYIYTYLYKYTWIELVRSQLESSFRSLWTVLIMSAPVSGVIPKSFRRPNQTYECTIRWPILGHFTDLKNLGLIPFLTRTGIVDLQVPPMMGPWLYSNLEANFAAHNY